MRIYRLPRIIKNKEKSKIIRIKLGKSLDSKNTHIRCRVYDAYGKKLNNYFVISAYRRDISPITVHKTDYSPLNFVIYPYDYVKIKVEKEGYNSISFTEGFNNSNDITVHIKLGKKI